MMEPKLGLQLITVGGWVLIALGVTKLLIWLAGEMFPVVYSKIESQRARNFMTGTGNRLIFGCGGLVTVLLGWGFVVLGNWLSGFTQTIL